MEIPLVDLRRQYAAIKNEVDRAVLKVFPDGIFILGKNVELFEDEFARYCNVKYGIGVASGSDALTLALKALGIKGEDEVITAANTFVSTADAIRYVGAKPVFADVDPETYCVNIEEIQKKITDKTKAIIPVHLYGHPADMNPIREIADQNGLFIVEDACQAHGAEYKGRKVGSLSDCACFSFYPSKVLGAYGDGGIILTDDESITEKIRMFRNYGQSKKYCHEFLGYNSRLDELQASILRVKLKYLDAWVEARRKVANLYQEFSSSLDKLTLPTEEEYAKHSYYVYAVRSKNRDALQRWLENKGVSTGIHYPIPIHLQPSYSYLRLGEGSYPVTEALSKQLLSLPMFPELSRNEIIYICNLLKDFCGSI